MTLPSPNAEQITLWNDRSGPRWVSWQPYLDAQLEELGARGLAALGDVAGMRVLDVGCGCGGSTLRLAAAVTSRGHVTGVDVSSPMLARAAERHREAGFAHADFVEADAQTHDFADAYDALFSRFGVMFFADPAAAFANLRRALRPGARVAMVTWRALEENPWMTVPLAAAIPHLPTPPAPAPPGAPGPFALADRARTLGLLAGAGFVDVAAEAVDASLAFAGGADLDTAVALALQVGPCGVALREHPAAVEPVRGAVREALARHLTDGVVSLRGAAWVYTARA